MASRKKKKTKTGRAKAARKPAKRSAAKPARARKATPQGLQLTSIAPGLTVNDLARSLAWYCDVLGLAIKQRWEHEGVLVGAELEAGRVAVHISQDDGKKGERVKGEGFRLYWHTDQDIDALAAGIRKRGGTLASEPKDEWGVRSFNLIDPTGFKITIGRPL